jgi:hypothetical protein
MTKKPRITITMEKQHREVLSRVAKANGVPSSRVVSDILASVMPYLERVVVLLEQAAKLKGKTIAAPLMHSLGRAEGRALQLSEDVLGQIDLFIAGTAAQAAAAADVDAQRPRPPEPTPVACNNGGQVVGKGGRPTAKAASTGRAGVGVRGGKRPRSAGQSTRKQAGRKR